MYVIYSEVQNQLQLQKRDLTIQQNKNVYNQVVGPDTDTSSRASENDEKKSDRYDYAVEKIIDMIPVRKTSMCFSNSTWKDLVPAREKDSVLVRERERFSYDNVKTFLAQKEA